MGDTKIEWANVVWNPVTGCTPISEGCQNCYAQRMAKRLGLDQPLSWKKPKRIFVCSMGDIFHEKVPDELLDQLWDRMWEMKRHTFLLLTKRVERMVEYVTKRAHRRGFGWTERESTFIEPGEFNHYDSITMRNECGYLDTSERNDDSDIDWLCMKSGEECDFRDCPVAYQIDERSDLKKIGVDDQYKYDSEGYAIDCEWMKYHTRPKNAGAGNVWLGFTAENQEQYEKRIRIFRRIRGVLGPYATLFCSMEPLLSPISFKIKYWPENEGGPNWSPLEKRDYSDGGGRLDVPTLNWVIAGGETGPAARPMHPDWARNLRDQCQAAGVPFFFKQWGEWAIHTPSAGGNLGGDLRSGIVQHVCSDRENDGHYRSGDVYMRRVGKRAAGRLLDGLEWNEAPNA